MRGVARRALVTAALGFIPFVPGAGNGGEGLRAALVIDDLGYSLERGRRALSLPAPATYGILPFTPYATELAEHAHRDDQEVILHLPMAAEDGRDPGPGVLSVSTRPPAVGARLHDALATVPHAVGISNHMGSMATRDPSLMQPLMRALSSLGVYFLDSRTTAATIACRTARRHGVPAIERDVFIDVDPAHSAMDFQWQRWLRLVREQGSAVAIAHPHPATLTFLEDRLADPTNRPAELVPLSRLLSDRPEDHDPCRPYSSPLPKVAKSSKPSP